MNESVMFCNVLYEKVYSLFVYTFYSSLTDHVRNLFVTAASDGCIKARSCKLHARAYIFLTVYVQ